MASKKQTVRMCSQGFGDTAPLGVTRSSTLLLVWWTYSLPGSLTFLRRSTVSLPRLLLYTYILLSGVAAVVVGAAVHIVVVTVFVNRCGKNLVAGYGFVHVDILVDICAL